MSSAAHPSVLAPLPGAASSSRTLTRGSGAGVPWYIWTGVVAITSSMIGGAWDVAWHRSIGRDSFWTPAHLMIQACAILAAVVGLYLVYQCTFNRNAELRAASISVFGLRAPLGVFLAGWGGVAMLTSAPFDNWWHNAYGLDVKIVSPPHALLVLGIRGVSMGVLFLILAAMNRAAQNEPAQNGTTQNRAFAQGDTNFLTLRNLLLYLGGLTVGGQMFFLQEYTWDVGLHRAIAYCSLAIAVPVVFAMMSQASRFRWAATTCAAVYTLYILMEILIFPLMAAQPKLGPVFNPVTHLIPAKFPILILAPALALDLLWNRLRSWKPWQIALVSGVVFVAVLTAVEWPFAKFLLSKASENRFFGTTYFDYNSPADGPDRLRLFVNPDGGTRLVNGLLRASVYASISTWVGLRFGRWMRGVQR